MTHAPNSTIRLCWIALFTFLIPVVCINAALFVALLFGDIPDCIPYWQGCVSISGVGRAESSRLLFRGVMLPYCGLLMLYWVLTYHWLMHLGSERKTLAKVLATAGVLSVLFLILHLVNLGEPGDTSQRMRRIGVNGNLLLTFLAQVLLTRALYPLKFQGQKIRGVRAKTLLCVVMLMFGLASIPVGELEHNKRVWQNIIEWNFFALVFIYFWFSFRGWDTTGFTFKRETSRISL